MDRRRLLYIGLGVAIVLIGGVAIAYAALSSSLNTTFSGVTQSALTWNVGFTGTSASATAGGTSATGRSCGTATITSSSVSVASTTLSKPGDSCRYTLTIKNSGTIGATLGSVTPTRPTGTGVSCSTATGGKMVCGNISYWLTTDTAGTFLTTGTSLAPNTSKTVYLTVQYDGTGVNSSAITQSGAKFTVTYNQA